MALQKRLWYDKDHPEGVVVMRPKLKAVPEAPASKAMQRLAALEAASTPPIVEHIIDGETWYIRRLSWPEMIVCGLMAQRIGPQQIELKTLFGARSNVASMLCSCVVTDPAEWPSKNEPQYYFTEDDAVQFAMAPAASDLVASLWSKIAEVNPELLGLRRVATTAASEPSPASVPPDGGSPTLTLIEQPESPTSSE